jgi:hypothetical protein
MSRLLGFYPPGWRERYGAEMQDLLSARPPTLADRVDLLLGAFDAWIHPQVRRTKTAVAERHSGSRAAAIPVILALLGGALFVASGLTLGTTPYFTAAGYKDSGLGVALLAAGMLLTSISVLLFASETGPRRAARVMVGGALVTLVPVWPILIFGFFTYIGATIALGVLLLAGRRWLGLAVLAIGIVLPNFNTEDERALVAVPVGILWILFGLTFRTANLKIPTVRSRRETAPG